MENVSNLQTVLAGLAADSAKRRERAIRELAPGALQDQQVVDALQNIVSTDPVDYVREAARVQLLAAGQVPAQFAYDEWVAGIVSQMENSSDIQTILEGIIADSAKRRERTIRELTPGALQDQRMIDALQNIVSRDPVEYVREAARAQLLGAGQTPAQSIVPAQLEKQSTKPILVVAIGWTVIPVALVIIGLVLTMLLVYFGPQIGNIISRVTNGLGGP